MFRTPEDYFSASNIRRLLLAVYVEISDCLEGVCASFDQ